VKLSAVNKLNLYQNYLERISTMWVKGKKDTNGTSDEKALATKLK
jgi:hypothetical protein